MTALALKVLFAKISAFCALFSALLPLLRDECQKRVPKTVIIDMPRPPQTQLGQHHCFAQRSQNTKSVEIENKYRQKL
jgi:hypothetical protein